MSFDFALAPPGLHATTAAMTVRAPEPAALACRYLLALHVPVYVDAQGQRWTERLWMVDLQRHRPYIRHLTVACPFVHAEPPPDCVPLDVEGEDGVDGAVAFVAVPWLHSSAAALLRAPRTLVQLWRLVGRSDFVHSIYGNWWPLSTPYLVNLVARLRGKCLMVIVEASPWRVPRGEHASAWRRFQAWSAERLNRWTLSLADLAVFTHEGYRRDLLPHRAERGHVLHASWIDEAAVLDAEAARARWQARPPQQPLRLLFAGRLQEDKGLHVLFDALARLRRADGDALARLRSAAGGARVELSIVGSGALEAACRAQAAIADARVQVEVLDPVPYGEPLFALMRRFDALVVPSLADEQPCVVYDAYSQAVPVLASATPGLAACVADDTTGRLFAPSDAAALARTIEAAAADPSALQALALGALDAARAMTHQEMHRRRHALIAKALAERGLA
jgi:glycosyltransferase involved in cell wall biosynthesis